MPLTRFTLYPWMGTVTSVPADDPTLITSFGQNAGISRDVGGQHFDIRKVRHTTSKSDGYTKITNTSCGTGAFCQGLYELYDGNNRNFIMFYNGIGYYLSYDTGSWEPIRFTPTTVSFNSTEMQYNFSQYGSYLIFCDGGTTTPYKWANSYIVPHFSEANTKADKLIQSGTEYIFKYTEFFQGRIIGAYSDQTNGDLEIRWTNILPNVATLSFPGTSQLYKGGSDSIVALRRMGGNACYLYGQTSISRIDYYPDFTTPFAIITMVEGQSCSCHSSIITLPDRHFFFNRHYGFVEYTGGVDWKVISEDIEDKMDISHSKAARIVGSFDPYHKELVWLVSASDTIYPSTIYRYDIRTAQWRVSPWAFTSVDRWTVLLDSETWAELAEDHDTWSGAIAAGHIRWSDAFTYKSRIVYAGTSGHAYYEGGESADGSDIDSFRIEPIMDMGDPVRKKHLLEIWFGFGKIGTYLVHCWWRGGDTAAECESHEWELLGSIRPCAANSASVVYVNSNATSKNERFHQIKWGTDGTYDQYECNRIDFYFHPQGKY